MTELKVMVSICMITYNQENYIAEAIEGVVNQKTNFKFELLIGEDCSIDNTRQICKEYKQKYPNIIKLSLPEKNLGADENFQQTINMCAGKYLALCEGDDYWTDPFKLQKQFDFMEENTDCSLCFHASEYIYSNESERNFIYRPANIPNDNKFSIKHAILGGGSFMATNSMFFIHEYVKIFPEWMKNSPVGDLPLMLILAIKGKIGYIDDNMSVYRVMSENSWSKEMQHVDKRKSHDHAISQMWDSFDRWSEYKYHRHVVLKKIKNYVNRFKYNMYNWLK